MRGVVKGSIEWMVSLGSSKNSYDEMLTENLKIG